MSVEFASSFCPLLLAKPSAAQLAAWVRLTLEPTLTPSLRRQLLQMAGSPEAIAELPPATLHKLLGEPVTALLLAPPAAAQAQLIEQTLAWANMPGNRLLVYAEPDYPPNLRHLHDPPLLLYVRGSSACLQSPMVALVGSRLASPAGSELAYAFAQELAGAGWCVVSGLARGIDTAAHRGALAAQPSAGTVAVMANGIDRIYPASNLKLAHRILAAGAVISELPLGSPSVAYQFPRRNRLVAALAQGVVVIEAAAKSGSLITARLAAELGREVFAVPGSIHAAQVKGCHMLIREGAQLIESTAEILAALATTPRLPLVDTACRWHVPEAEDKTVERTLRSPFDATFSWADPEVLAAVRHALGHDPASVDALLQRTDLPSPALQAGLLALELAGAVRRLPDGRWVAITPAGS